MNTTKPAPTFRTEFTDFPANTLPVIPAGFVDCSWHNDTCPSFVNEEAGLMVFVDYLDPDKREFPESLRFSLHTYDGGIGEPFICSDDWSEIVAAIEAATPLHGIARNAPVMVDSGEAVRSTWGEFIDTNADAVEAGDVDPAEIAKGLLKRPGCTYFGGGGAAAQWTIRLLVGDEVKS